MCTYNILECKLSWVNSADTIESRVVYQCFTTEDAVAMRALFDTKNTQRVKIWYHVEVDKEK